MSLNNLKNKLSNEKKIFSSFQIQKQSKKKKETTFFQTFNYRI